MSYRKSLEQYFGQTIDIKATIRCANLRFRKPLISPYIGSDLICPAYKIHHKYISVPVLRETGNATCLENILINDQPVGLDTDHIWVPYGLNCLADNGRVHLIGIVGKYKTKYKEDYGVKILGRPL